MLPIEDAIGFRTGRRGEEHLIRQSLGESRDDTKEVLGMAKENGAKMVNLNLSTWQIWQHFSVPISESESPRSGYGFDGSSSGLASDYPGDSW